MRAILIDPTEKTVSEIEIAGGYRSIQKALGDVVFTIAGHIGESDLYVDDEGLLKGGQDFFLLSPASPQPLAGKGLLLGCTKDGDSAPCTLNLSDIEAVTRYLRHEDGRWRYVEPEAA